MRRAPGAQAYAQCNIFIFKLKTLSVTSATSTYKSSTRCVKDKEYDVTKKGFLVWRFLYENKKPLSLFAKGAIL